MSTYLSMFLSVKIIFKIISESGKGKGKHNLRAIREITQYDRICRYYLYALTQLYSYEAY